MHKENMYVGKKITQSQGVMQKDQECFRINKMIDQVKRKPRTYHKRSLFEFDQGNTLFYGRDNEATPSHSPNKELSTRKKGKSKSLQNLRANTSHSKHLQNNVQRNIQHNIKDNVHVKIKKNEQHNNVQHNIQCNVQYNVQCNVQQKINTKVINKNQCNFRPSIVLHHLNNKEQNKTTHNYINQHKLTIQVSKSKSKSRSKSQRKIFNKQQKLPLSKKPVSNVLQRNKQRDISPIVHKKQLINCKQTKNTKPKQKTQIKIITVHTGSTDIKYEKHIQKKKKNSKNSFKKQAKSCQKKKSMTIFEAEAYFSKMATRIQALWRGYKLRKQLTLELEEISIKASIVKEHILQFDNKDESQMHSIKRIEQLGEVSNNYKEQLQKLKKQIQERDAKFKQLAQENLLLKQKINHTPITIKEQNYSQSESSQISIKQQMPIYAPTQKQNSITREQTKQNLLQIQNQNQSQLNADICSPKFIDPFFTTLFSKKQKQLKQCYTSESKKLQSLFIEHAVSPRTCKIKSSQLLKQFKSQRLQTIDKLKQAQNALLLIKELDYSQTNQQTSQIIKVDDSYCNNNAFESQINNSEQLFSTALQKTNHDKHPHNDMGSSKQKMQQIQGNKQCFETDMKYLRDYCVSLCQYFRSRDTYKNAMLDEVQKPVSIKYQVLLRSYRLSMQGDDIEQLNRNTSQLLFPYFSSIYEYKKILPMELFTEMQENRVGIKELQQYHDLAIFDALNEALQYERPGGRQEKYELNECNNQKKSVKQKKENKQTKEVIENNLDHLLCNAIGRMINDWASCLCGFINNEEDTEDFSEQKVKEVRMSRECIMLHRFLAASNHIMHDSPLHFIALKLLLSYQIQNILIQEVTSFCSQLNKSNGIF